MKYSRIVSFLDHTIQCAWREFSLGLLVYTGLLAASVFLLYISLREDSKPKLISSTIAILISLVCIYLFAYFFPILGKEDLAIFKFSAMVIAFFALIGVINEIYFN